MSSRPVILAYHAIGECPRERDPGNLFVTPAAFERQMSYLARRKKVVSLEQALANPTGDNVIVITFDDAYRNVLTQAGPILARYGFPATVFVPTGWIGRRNEWDRPAPTCDVDIMTEQELQQAHAAGITAESHGHSHIDMGSETSERIREDIASSIEALTALTDRRPRFLAYPFGRESPEARSAATEAGLEVAFTIDAPHDGPFAWERVPVTPLDGPALFALKTSGHYLRMRYSAPVAAAYRVVRPLVRRSIGG